MIYVHVKQWNYMPSKMWWCCQVSIQGSGGSLVPSDIKSRIREFPKTEIVVCRGADGRSLVIKIG